VLGGEVCVTEPAEVGARPLRVEAEPGAGVLLEKLDSDGGDGGGDERREDQEHHQVAAKKAAASAPDHRVRIV
jgi:hypothetical protein